MKIRANKRILDIGVKMVRNSGLIRFGDGDDIESLIKVEVIDIKRNKNLGRYDLKTFKLKFGVDEVKKK